MEKCSNCGACSLVWEDSKHVCTNCGVIVQEGSFTAEYSSTCAPIAASKDFKQYCVNLPHTLYGATIRPEAPPCQGFKECSKALDDLAARLLLSSDRKATAQELFKTVFYHSDFKVQLVGSKHIMAGVCVYIICRQNDIPVTVSQMCLFLGCQVGDFVRWKRQILSTFSIEITAVSLEELVSVQCREIGLNDSIINDTEQIVQICRSVWLVEGRKPQYVIIAAAFLAWKSEDWATRMKLDLNEFCKRHKIARVQAITSRVREMTNVLISLAREIPWVSSASVNKKSFIVYIQDIIKFKNTLLTSALERTKLKEVDETQEKTPDMQLETASLSERKGKVPSLDTKTETVGKFEPSPMSDLKMKIVNVPHREPPGPASCKRNAEELAEPIDYVSQPPIAHMKKQKVDVSRNKISEKKILHDLDCPELGPDDMSDCELKMYV